MVCPAHAKRPLVGTRLIWARVAEFYAFYSVFSKFSTIWGTAVFSAIELATGSSRNAIISLTVFFIAGLVLLAFVNVDSAKEARKGELFG